MKVVEVKKFADEFDEDKYTKMYMKKYGIDRVRGGSYTQMNLPEYSKQTLEKELCSASDLCFRCNRPGHFANKCYAKTKIDGAPVADEKTGEDLKAIINDGVAIVSSLFSSISIHKVVFTEDGNTKLEMTALAITKIRETKKSKIELDGKQYNIVSTKRDLGLFAGSKNNFVIIEGRHEIPAKSYSLSMH
jgi:hypothetical protein